MKKVFFLVAFLFSMVCYAAPPTDNPAGFLTEDVGVFRSRGDMAFQSLDVQEVAFAYIGNESHRSLFITIIQPEDDCGFINRLQDWNVNKQNTNFGYPFGANF